MATDVSQSRGGQDAGGHGRDRLGRVELADGLISVAGGEIEFSHPREGMDVLDTSGDDERFPPYWAELWHSGIELAYAVSKRELRGRGVLELGCGLGLPSIAAALGGADVLATDRSPEALGLAVDNARRNGVELATAELCWSEPGRLLDDAPWELVMAADVLYNDDSVDWLEGLLPKLVGAGGEVWIADPRRPHADRFLDSVTADFDVHTESTRMPTVHLHRLRPR